MMDINDMSNDELYDHAYKLEEENEALKAALCTATTQVRDLVNDWPVRELCETPKETYDRLTLLVPNHSVSPLDR